MNTIEYKDADRQDLPSASSAQRRRACPGSRQAEIDNPKPPTSAIADEGTLIHRAIETVDMTGLTDEQANIAERIIGLMDSAYGKWASSLKGTSLEHMKEFREYRFWILHPTTGEKMESAKLDVAHVCGDYGIVIDAKSGFLDAIPSAKNYQLRMQALALWNAYPNLKEITVSIAQVRFKSRYDSCVYTQEELLMAQREFMLSDWMSRQPDAPRSAGSHCRYCPAADNCHTAGAYALIAQNSMAVESQDEKAILDRVNSLSHSQLAKLHSYASISTKVFEAAKDRLKGLTEEELNEVGLSKGKPSKVAEVEDIKAVLAARSIFVDKTNSVTVSEFDAHVSLALGKVEKIAVGRLAKRSDISQKVAKEKLREDLKGCISYSEKSASLVPFAPENKQIQE